MSLEGKIIGGRYEVQEKIGMGGMATVYSAKDNILKRNVAIKVLRDEFTTDDEFVKRFNSEAQSAASLTHPNIVSIFDVGHEEDMYFIVMELIKGKTLKEIINEDGALPWKWSVNIAIQIASALETAHRNNIVHRDIKPHNIIITEDGVAKVTDFGIAKAVSNSTITAFGTTIGSVHYLSPEHARGGFTDAKSDIYSLGVVMYEMLTGKVPFDADTPVSVALKHMQEKPVEPIKLRPDLPSAINKIIMKAMEKEGSLRYSSATEMLKDLSLALKDPQGNFVKTKPSEEEFTRQIPTLGMDDMDKEKNKRKGKIRAFFEKHKKTKRTLIVLLIILMMILIPFIGFWGTQMVLSAGRPKDVVLPNLIGKTQVEAEEELKNSGLQIEIKEEYDDKVETGKVISQNPQFLEDYTVKENSTVEVIISKGTEMKDVPKLVGKTYDEAVRELENNKIEVEKIEKISQTVEKGVVIEQEPENGEKIKAGEKVKLYVSSGNGLKQIVVQHVIGKKEKEAKESMTKEGLEVEVVYEEDHTKTDATVLKQSIDAGKTVEEGTKIILTVNKIATIKNGNVKINLKSITGGVIKTRDIVDEKTGKVTGTEEINPLARVVVKVDGTETYRDSHRLDSELTLSGSDGIKGRGKVSIEVSVTWEDENGTEKSRNRSGEIDFNTDKLSLEIN